MSNNPNTSNSDNSVSNSVSNCGNTEQYYYIHGLADSSRTWFIVDDHIKAKYTPIFHMSLLYGCPICKTTMTVIMRSFKHLIWLTDDTDFELEVRRYDQIRNIHDPIEKFYLVHQSNHNEKRIYNMETDEWHTEELVLE